MEKKPCVSRISPEPPQVPHVFGLVPGFAPEPWQVSHRRGRGILSRAVVPKAAFSKEIFRS